MALFTAIYDYDGATAQQGVSFNTGDTIDVAQKEANGWWKGTCTRTNESGWFPASYVEIVPAAAPPVPAAPPPAAPPPAAPPAPPPAAAKPAGGPPPKPGAAPPPKPGGPPPKPGAPPPAAPPKTRESYFEDVGPAQNIAATGDGGKGFCDNFWNDKGGKTGFDVLVLKHRNGKEIFKEMAEFLKQRAIIEDTYAKSMQKLSRSQDKYLDAGNIHEAYLAVKGELATTGDLHSAFAVLLTTKFEKRVMEFKDSQKGNRKAYEKSICERRKILVATVPNVEKLHDVYSTLVIECYKLKKGKVRGQQQDQTKRDFNKIVDTLASKEPARDKAGDSFKKSLEEYNTVQLDWINEMLLACKEFEDAERDRINFLKSLMSEYAAEGRKVSAGRVAAFDAIEAGYARVDPMQDIFAWTADASTGADRPRPFPYMTPAVIEDGYERQLAESAAKGKK